MAPPPPRARHHLRIALAVLALAAPLAAAAGPIQDNSFLLEEAYNQEPGVIQHISAFGRYAGDRWNYSFTEEWPVLGQTHQASATFSYAQLAQPARGLGDVALSYRCQVLGSGEAPVALAPRLTLLLPTGDASRGLGNGGVGVQVNLPLSVSLGDHLVSHVNLGGTFVPSARAASGRHGDLTAFSIGQGLVWLVHPRFNLLVEALYTTSEIAAPGGLERTESLYVNPGVRTAIDFASGLQIVPGVGVPIGFGPSRGDTALFLYLSFEHPFRPAGPAAQGS